MQSHGGLVWLASNVASVCCALYRVCMVNNDGGLLLDQYVRPAEKVTDYRTFVSGIEPIHLKEGAVSLSEAQKQVAQILSSRILVGHAVHHDLQVHHVGWLLPACWAYGIQSVTGQACSTCCQC